MQTFHEGAEDVGELLIVGLRSLYTQQNSLLGKGWAQDCVERISDGNDLIFFQTLSY